MRYLVNRVDSLSNRVDSIIHLVNMVALLNNRVVNSAEALNNHPSNHRLPPK